MTTDAYSTTPPPEYKPFPNIARRNIMQEALEVPALVHLLDLPKGVSILEVGCGRGVALSPLSKLLRPELLVGLDSDANLIAMAEERLTERNVEASLTVADVRRMPFTARTFDLVIDFGTCHHISGPENAVHEIVRVLKPGGYFVAETLSSQLLSHPLRSRRKRLPWQELPELSELKGRLLWKTRVRS